MTRRGPLHVGDAIALQRQRDRQPEIPPRHAHGKPARGAACGKTVRDYALFEEEQVETASIGHAGRNQLARLGRPACRRRAGGRSGCSTTQRPGWPRPNPGRSPCRDRIDDADDRLRLTRQGQQQVVDQRRLAAGDRSGIAIRRHELDLRITLGQDRNLVGRVDRQHLEAGGEPGPDTIPPGSARRFATRLLPPDLRRDRCNDRNLRLQRHRY